MTTIDIAMFSIFIVAPVAVVLILLTTIIDKHNEHK